MTVAAAVGTDGIKATPSAAVAVVVMALTVLKFQRMTHAQGTVPIAHAG